MNRRIENDEKIGYVLDEEFISEFARQYGLERDLAKRIIESVFILAQKTLLKNSLLNIRGFGIFHIKWRKPFKYYIRHTGTWQEKGSRKVIKFKPALSLRRILNADAKEAIFKMVKDEKRITDRIRRAGGFTKIK
jgi:nucleoid DNA-binding protein